MRAVNIVGISVYASSDVPWYHLDKLHISVKSALTDSYNSDEQFAWILANKPKELASVVSLPQPPKVVSKAS